MEVHVFKTPQWCRTNRAVSCSRRSFAVSSFFAIGQCGKERSLVPSGIEVLPELKASV